ncbi:MAG: glutamate racemase [bacterium JZ-2024 1]
MATEKIGVFDSGVGGLSILKELVSQIPWADYIYVADIAHLPFGDREPQEILQIASILTQWLVGQQCNAVVMACNISSAVALREMRRKHLIPIFGVLQGGIRKTLMSTRNRRVGVLTTTATLKSGVIQKLFENTPYSLVIQDCPEWVPLIEKNEAFLPENKPVFEKYIKRLQEAEVDTILPACTHYLLVLSLLEEIAGEGITVIDPSAEVAREVAMVFPSKNSYSSGNLEFHLTAPSETFEGIAQRILGRSISVQVMEQAITG